MFDIWNACERCGCCFAEKVEKVVERCCGGVLRAVKVAVMTCACGFVMEHEVEAAMKAPPPQSHTHTPETASTDPANPSHFTNVGTPTTTTAGPTTRPYIAYPPDDFPPFPGAVIQSRPPRG